jgi:glyoxylase-like metal-dependent hydrolase (beta-lactamase superfamily II)
MADHFDVFMLNLGALGANCFLLASGGKALIVDPGDEADVVAAACDEIAAAPQAILVTHGHFDHIGGVDALARQFAVPVYVGEADAGLLRRPDMGAMAGFAVQPVTVDPVLLDAETELDLALPVTAVPTPGHSEGSFSFFIEGHLFSGDVLFQGSIGRTDLPGGSSDVLLNSIAGLIRRFAPDTVVHCGHGPDTSLGRELALNPFLSPLRYDPEHRW